jgi:hypothetical protein
MAYHEEVTALGLSGREFCPFSLLEMALHVKVPSLA